MPSVAASDLSFGTLAPSKHSPTDDLCVIAAASLPPTMASCSTTTTRAPDLAHLIAALRPAMPPPTIRMESVTACALGKIDTGTVSLHVEFQVPLVYRCANRLFHGIGTYDGGCTDEVSE